jgi:hypothetical protein
MEEQEFINQVVAAASDTYRRTDHDPIATDIEGSFRGNSIYLPKLRRFEMALQGVETLSDIDLHKLENFRNEGIEVWVLVPLASMGKAHNRFRGFADRIQSWWLDDVSKRIKFGTAETP